MREIPQTIGRYRILERVGTGGMGVLYRGIDPVLDRDVAIKLMLTDVEADNDQMRARFSREARAVAKLQHRNIVTIFEFAEDNGTQYMVMEFLRGTSLAARLAAAPPLTLDDKLDIVSQLCAGLAYAHQRGVVHRDVKPANVFILTDGSVKLLDFGIAKTLDSNLTRLGDTLGSLHYMSPEQAAGSDSIDARADVFSTGAMLYEMLTGRRPFDGPSPTAVLMKILDEDPVPLKALVPQLPDALVAVVNRALAKNPAMRFNTAADLERELLLIRKGEGQAETIIAGAFNQPPPATASRFAPTAVTAAPANTTSAEPTAAPDTAIKPAPTVIISEPVPAPPPLPIASVAVPKPLPVAVIPAQAAVPPPQAAARPTSSRTVWLAAAAAVIFVMIGGLIAVAIWGRGGTNAAELKSTAAPAESKPAARAPEVPAAPSSAPAPPPPAPEPAPIPTTVVTVPLIAPKPAPPPASTTGSPAKNRPASSSGAAPAVERPAVARPPEAAVKCAQFIEKISLGEPLTATEREYREKYCKD